MTAEAQRKYYASRKDDSEFKAKRAASNRRYRASNRQRLAEKRAAYLAEKRDDPEFRAAGAEASRRWRTRNPESRLASDRRWREANRGAYNERMAARRAATRTNDPRIVALYEIAAWLRDMGDDVHVDHIVPLAKGGEHVYDNLQILPARENQAKGAR